MQNSFENYYEFNRELQAQKVYNESDDNWSEYCKEHDAFYNRHGRGCLKCFNVKLNKNMDELFLNIMEKLK